MFLLVATYCWLPTAACAENDETSVSHTTVVCPEADQDKKAGDEESSQQPPEAECAPTEDSAAELAEPKKKRLSKKERKAARREKIRKAKRKRAEKARKDKKRRAEKKRKAAEKRAAEKRWKRFVKNVKNVLRTIQEAHGVEELEFGYSDQGFASPGFRMNMPTAQYHANRSFRFLIKHRIIDWPYFKLKTFAKGGVLEFETTMISHVGVGWALTAEFGKRPQKVIPFVEYSFASPTIVTDRFVGLGDLGSHFLFSSYLKLGARHRGVAFSLDFVNFASLGIFKPNPGILVPLMFSLSVDVPMVGRKW